MNRLAVCLITHDYVECLKDVIKINLPIWKQNGIDLFVIDSSKKNKDKYSFWDEGVRAEIQYIHVPDCVRLEEKMNIVFKQMYGLSQYDYVWPIGQRRIVSEKLCKEIMECINQQSDFITIFDGAEKRQEMITDRQAYFVKCSEQSILLGAAVYRKTILERLNLDVLYEKYRRNDTSTFYQMSVYFEGIAEVKKFRGHAIYIQNGLTTTKVEAVKYWERDRFLTWADTLPDFYLKLPDIYQSKEEIIKKIQREKFDLSFKEIWLCIRRESITKSVLSKYEKYFKENMRLFYIKKVFIFCMLSLMGILSWNKKVK